MALSTEDPKSSTRLAPEFYQAYLNSSTWRTVRNRALRLAKYQCSKCGSRRDPNVHHKTYERLGAERDADLEVLCFTCHNAHHVEESTTKADPLGVYLKVVSVVIARDPFARIADISEDVKTLCAQKKIPVVPELIHKAISLACATRLREAKKPYQSVVEVPLGDNHPVTPAQAIELLTRLRVQLRGPGAAVKSMPKARMVTQQRADQLKAFSMVTREIEESIYRCEQLEKQGA